MSRSTLEGELAITGHDVSIMRHTMVHPGGRETKSLELALVSGRGRDRGISLRIELTDPSALIAELVAAREWLES